jgi:hypothetical protein
MLLTHTTPTARLLSVLFLAMFITCGVHGSFFIQENGVLVPSSSEYHAYDDSWSVNFNNVDAVDFDILVFEVCSQQPCPSQFDEVSELLDCAGLIDHFNDSTWYNQYVSERISLHGICQSIHDRNDELQIGANNVLLDGDGRPWLNVRQPLALEFMNDEHMLELWTRRVNASDGAMETSRLVREIVVRVTQVLKLQRVFALHKSVMRVFFAAPEQSSITFGVQNPCSARGYAAPDFGAVAQRFLDGRERCMWTCRMDLWRQPYNSIPATRQQLNSSHPDFAALDPKYACAVLPKQWVAVFFGFELDTRMLATSHEYTQVLYDALDSMARSIEKRLAKPGRTVLVSLGVHDSLYHTVSFREQLREKSETACLLAQCHSKWFPSAYGWNNEHFVYARRTFESAVSGSLTDFSDQVLGFLGFNFRLGDGAEPLQSLVAGPFVAPLANELDARPRTLHRHGPRVTSLRRRTMHLNKLQVDGVVISDDVLALFDSAYRLNMISNLRKEVRAQGDVLDSFSPTMQISQVEDFDISNVLGFVDPEQNPQKTHTPQDATVVSYSDSNYLIVVVSISLIITSVLLLVCGSFVREVLEKRERRHRETQYTSAY